MRNVIFRVVCENQRSMMLLLVFDLTFLFLLGLSFAVAVEPGTPTFVVSMLNAVMLVGLLVVLVYFIWRCKESDRM